MTSHPPSPSYPRDGERTVELVPGGPSSAGSWTVLLAGPVVWIVHFLVVYLLAEAACSPAALASEGGPPIPAGAVTAAVVAVTALAAVAVVVAGLVAWRSWRGDDGHRSVVGLVGVLVAAGSLYAVLAVGLPVLLLDPC